MRFDSPVVLIGTSLGEHSDRLVEIGVRIARAAGARIHLVHAYDLTVLYTTIAVGGGICTPDTFAAARDGRRQLVAAQAARLGIGGGELTLAAVEGTPHRVLVEAAAASGAGLIVVGAAEHWSGRDHLFGSTAERVVRAASCPVLAVRGDLGVPPRRVLVAVDLSAAAGDAMALGLATLASLGVGPGRGEAAIQAVYVAPPANPGAHFAASERPATPDEALARFVSGRLPGAGWDIGGQVRRGTRPACEILAASAEMAADLLILGTHGSTGFDRFVTGSVAESVLRRSTASVLIVPPRQAFGGVHRHVAQPAA